MSVNLVDQIDLSKLSEEDYLKLAYITLLQRKIDPSGLKFWKEKIDNKHFKYKDLLDVIYNSPEFIMHYKVSFSAMLHRARQEWCSSLDKFKYVLDIGGSSPNIEMGALIELGYQHRPKELVVFDLPEDEQYWGKPKFAQNRDYTFDWGTLKYEHGHAEYIERCKSLSDGKFDCVFMGQTIEHINKNRLSSLLSWIRGHLVPKGKFIFDTPNRDVTKIQSPHKYIDDDHKYEYTPIEMEQILRKNGFKVVKGHGLLDMPSTFA